MHTSRCCSRGPHKAFRGMLSAQLAMAQPCTLTADSRNLQWACSLRLQWLQFLEAPLCRAVLWPRCWRCIAPSQVSVTDSANHTAHSCQSHG